MNKKMNNKGFSLVELIIVIAIMAVLVGVLAPAYTRYVENTRKSRDISALDSVLTSVETAMIDENARTNLAEDVTITVSATTIVVTCAGDADFEDDLQEMVGASYTLASSDWGTTSEEITASISGGSVTFTNDTAVTGNVDAMEAYSAAIDGRIN